MYGYNNFWNETIEVLKDHKKTWDDVKYIFGTRYQISKEDFEKVAKKTSYDSGYGSPKIPTDLEIWGEDFHLTRGEYDGSEWWDFHSHTPDVPIYLVPCIALTDVNDVGYLTLEEINGKLEHWDAMHKTRDLYLEEYKRALEEDPSINIVEDPILGTIITHRG